MSEPARVPTDRSAQQYQKDREYHRNSAARRRARKAWLEEDYVPPGDLQRQRKNEFKQPDLRGV